MRVVVLVDEADDAIADSGRALDGLSATMCAAPQQLAPLAAPTEAARASTSKGAIGGKILILILVLFW